MSERKAAIAAALTATRDQLQAITSGLQEADWQRPTPNEGWTIKDVLAHLTASEPGLVVMARRILNDEESAVAGFDVHRYNQRQVEKRRERSGAELLDDLAAARQETLALLAELSEAQLDKPGRRTTGEETTLEGVFRQISGHTETHTADIRRTLA